MSGCYIGIYRFVWMLIGSEITYDDALFILYEVRVIGNHADGDMVLLKKSCHEITLLRYPSTRGCPARHLMMPCQFRSKNVLCSTKYALRNANHPGFYVEPEFSPWPKTQIRNYHKQRKDPPTLLTAQVGT